MKRVIIICDGMADEPIVSLGGKTFLEVADTPCLDLLASKGRCGSLQTIPDSFYPGSEVAILSILGYSPHQLPEGRGPLEARGLGIKIPDGHTAFRYQIKPDYPNFPYISKLFDKIPFYPISETKGICIIPPDFEKSTLPENVELWSGDVYRTYIPFTSIHPHESGAITKTAFIAAVPLLKGIAYEIGADWIKPEHATGTPLTDFKEKGEAAIKALNDYDYVILHIEACDYASHARNLKEKINSIENIDKYIITPIAKYIMEIDMNVAIAVMSDHPSLCEKGCHSRANSPFLYYYPGIEADNVDRFDEESVKNGTLKEISDIYER